VVGVRRAQPTCHDVAGPRTQAPSQGHAHVEERLRSYISLVDAQVDLDLVDATLDAPRPGLGSCLFEAVVEEDDDVDVTAPRQRLTSQLSGGGTAARQSVLPLGAP